MREMEATVRNVWVTLHTSGGELVLTEVEHLTIDGLTATLGFTLAAAPFAGTFVRLTVHFGPDAQLLRAVPSHSFAAGDRLTVVQQIAWTLV